MSGEGESWEAAVGYLSLCPTQGKAWIHGQTSPSPGALTLFVSGKCTGATETIPTRTFPEGPMDYQGRRMSPIFNLKELKNTAPPPPPPLPPPH